MKFLICFLLVLLSTLSFAKEVNLMNAGNMPNPNPYLKTSLIDNGVHFEYNKPNANQEECGIREYKYIENYKNITFNLNVEAAGNTTLIISYSNTDSTTYTCLIPLKVSKKIVTLTENDFIFKSDWTAPKVRLAKNDEINYFFITVIGENANAKFDITNFTINTPNNSYQMFEYSKKPEPFTKSEKYPFDLKDPFRNDNTYRVVLAGGSDIIDKDWREGVKSLNEEFKGHFGIHLSKAYEPKIKPLLKELNDMGIRTSVEGHSGIEQYGSYFSVNNLFLKRYDGITGLDIGKNIPLFDLHDTSDPRFIECMDDYINEYSKFGYHEFLLIDYIWPWIGGSFWGYDGHMLETFKTFLNTTDKGLYLYDKNSKSYKKNNFWQYLTIFTDVKFSPKDLGITSWNEYKPVTPKEAAQGTEKEKKNLFLFVALYHYEYLQYIQTLGEYANTVGIDMMATVNPEDIMNGNDTYLLGKTKDVDKIAHEFFGRTTHINNWYHNMRRYSTIFKDSGTKFSLVGEINAGGHGPSRYDLYNAYIFYYVATMTARPTDYNNQYTENTVWPTKDNSDNRFVHWYSGAKAFMQAYSDWNNYQPKRKTILIASRSALELQDGFTDNMSQTGNINSILDSLHYSYEAIGKEFFDDYITDAKNIVYCPASSSKMHYDKLKEWLNKDSNKTLVTHSFVPYTLFTGSFSLAKNAEVVEWGYKKSYNRFDGPKEFTFTDTLVPFKDLKSNIDITLNGVTEKYDLYSSNGGEVLLSDGNGNPLVTKYKYNNNNIIYINIDVSKNKGEIAKYVVDFAAKKANIIKEFDGANNYGMQIFDVKGGKSIAIVNNDVIKQQDIDVINYFKRIPVDNQKIEVNNLKKNTEYIVYNFFNNTTTNKSTNNKGVLELSSNMSVDMFYIGEVNNKAFKKTLEEATKTRTALVKYE